MAPGTRSKFFFTFLSYGLVIVTLLLCTGVHCVPIPQEFQKPHFQVEHKAGVLSITATKDKADVDVKSDTIRLLVKPGDKQFPVGKEPEVKMVHVEHGGGCCGGCCGGGCCG
ncbi:uncharacterized protein LOC141894300 [Acropora palmata]|uniref:uncharacterized protein LOC141894300 n=1 Tax=Acropora palmata TaxID=6131 RepID=UPI003D9FD30D